MDESAEPASAPAAPPAAPAAPAAPPAPAAAAAPAAPAVPRSIGERLRAAREQSGLSIAASAEKLHLDPKVIEALEADRFAELGASVYVRGHLRRYADFVGEPGAELVGIYTAREARPPPPDLTQIPQSQRRSDPRRLVTPFVGLSAALVVVLAIYWVVSGSQDAVDAPPATAALQTPAPVSAPAGSVAAGAPASGGGAVPAAGTPAAAAPAAAAPANAATAASAPAARKEEAPPARATRLRLELASDSWVEIYDARGERLFYDVASAGSVQSVEGRPPLRVTLGSSVGVVVEVDGQRKEIPANAADGEGARFVVNRSGSLTRAR
jgi:cytoskeleton protein RodZ